MSKSNYLMPLAISTALLLTGCSIGPDYQVPTVTLEETYMNAQNTDSFEETAGWWYRFDDPVLNQLVEEAQQQNISLRVASERIQMAKNYHKIVESYKLPTVNIGAGYYHYQISENTPLVGDLVSPISVPANLQPALGSSVSVADNQQSGLLLGASVGWELDLFGRIEHQTQAAQIRTEQSVIYRKGLYTLITAEVIHNYLQLRGAQERIQVLGESISDQREILSLTLKVMDSGFGSELDVAQARANLAAVESMLPQLKVSEQVHKHRLSILLEKSLRDIDAQLAAPGKIKEIEGVIPTGLPSGLLSRRFDIAFAEREMAAINQEVGAAVANQYPKFFLTGAPGLSAGDFSDLFNSDSLGWVGSAGISWNVFDAGRGDAMVAFNEARFKSAVLEYQNRVDTAFKEVDSMLFTYGRSKENQAKVNVATNETAKAVDKAKSLYKAGLVDSFSVLDAQRQLNMMRDQQVIAKLQTTEVTVKLYKALGGDWSLPESQ
ncbi:efflux transporter outer membrane subunit [Vibrio sp. THAF190c]|uniref:efflux transporter outer membrane subunit n=1 Tax=Vibrio sp. THAF190c TaxID=2587865 RepID=UPI0012682323|nr:efflux transporter outer membrane subunit [Vibrio sp. THAF190c]QFT13016.1 Outer membrane protein OprM precursor [Vibrio sp. THAF190c]